MDAGSAITNNRIQANSFSDGGGGGVSVAAGGTLIMRGGRISGNYLQGVCCTPKGDNPSNHTPPWKPGQGNLNNFWFGGGGGVFLSRNRHNNDTNQDGNLTTNDTSHTNPAVFIMEGGVIAANQVTSGGGPVVGGGVCVSPGAQFTMKGGAIYGDNSNAPSGMQNAAVSGTGAAVGVYTAYEDTSLKNEPLPSGTAVFGASIPIVDTSAYPAGPGTVTSWLGIETTVKAP
jgi:hypothetical protein